MVTIRIAKQTLEEHKRQRIRAKNYDQAERKKRECQGIIELMENIEKLVRERDYITLEALIDNPYTYGKHTE